MRMLKNPFESQLIKSASWLVSPMVSPMVSPVECLNCMLLFYCRKFVMVSPASPCFFSLTWFPVWLCVTKNFPSSNILKKIFDTRDGNHEGVWCPWIQSKNETPSPHWSFGWEVERAADVILVDDIRDLSKLTKLTCREDITECQTFTLTYFPLNMLI